MDTANQTCGAFLDALASKAPTPGGGGASALVGALGTALCTMVATTRWARRNMPGWRRT